MTTARVKLATRKQAYETIFGPFWRADAGAGLIVREDLGRFCRAFQSCWHPDARMNAVLEGRREVWLRIEQHFNLSPDELAVVYRAVVTKQPGEL